MCRLMWALTFFILVKNMKFLYIDESADNNVFVVGGVLISNEVELLNTYKHFKKSAVNSLKTRRDIEKVCNEFKSVLLDKSYPKIKRKLLNSINESNISVVYSVEYLQEKLYQDTKEKIYIDLLSRIVKGIDEPVLIITFDSFGNKKFEDRIKSEIGNIDNVSKITCDYSYNCKGLQFADNVCGVIRRNLSGIDEHEFYKIIENIVTKY